MTKNILKKFYLTDEYEEDDVFLNDDTSLKDSDYTIVEDSQEDSDSDDESDLEEDEPKIEFIVEEDENKEKQIRMNFEFKVDNLNEVVKIDLEISKKTYLEIADELMK